MEKTATDLSFERMITQREQIALHEIIEWFFNKYAPDDQYENSRFHADFISVVQRIYSDAQAPLIKQMTAAMGLAPLRLDIIPAEQAGKVRE